VALALLDMAERRLGERCRTAQREPRDWLETAKKAAQAPTPLLTKHPGTPPYRGFTQTAFCVRVTAGKSELRISSSTATGEREIKCQQERRSPMS
jgi:hypothetical protein